MRCILESNTIHLQTSDLETSHPLHSCNTLQWTQHHCYQLLTKLPKKLLFTTVYVCKVVYKTNLQIVSPGCFSMHCKYREAHIAGHLFSKSTVTVGKNNCRNDCCKIFPFSLLQKYFSHCGNKFLF